jgi:hypothetical protein
LYLFSASRYVYQPSPIEQHHPYHSNYPAHYPEQAGNSKAIASSVGNIAGTGMGSGGTRKHQQTDQGLNYSI